MILIVGYFYVILAWIGWWTLRRLGFFSDAA